MHYTLSPGKNSEDCLTNYQQNGLYCRRAGTRRLISMVRLIKWLLSSENELLALLNMMGGEWRVPTTFTLD